MTLQPNDGNEGLDTAGEAAKPWRKEAFEPEWMKKPRMEATLYAGEIYAGEIGSGSVGGERPL